MNRMHNHLMRCLFLLLTASSCVFWSGCCTSTLERISRIHEVVKPQEILCNYNGAIAVKVVSSYYSREQYSDSKDAPMEQYPPRARYLELDPTWLKNLTGKKAAGSTVRIPDIFFDNQPYLVRVIPKEFLAPGADAYSIPLWQDATAVRHYTMDQAVPYPAQNGTVYLSLAKTQITSNRTQDKRWAIPLQAPAEAIDTVMQLVTGVVMLPIAAVIVPVGFVVLGVMMVFDEDQKKTESKREK